MLKKCKQCKQEKDAATDFHQIFDRRYRVGICWDCARSNMHKWSRTGIDELNDMKRIHGID